MRLALSGDMAEIETLIKPQTLAQFEARLQMLFAGRSTGRLLVGDASACAGGGEARSPAAAPDVALRIESVFGHGSWEPHPIMALRRGCGNGGDGGRRLARAASRQAAPPGFD
jgi:hypothetical protein